MHNKPEKQKEVENDQFLSTESVITHFGNLKTRLDPTNASLKSLPGNENLNEIVSDFIERLGSSETYLKQDILGEGGMGTIEKVKDTRSLRSIAMKILPKEGATEEDFIRFAEEAQITAQLEHPNIIPVYDLGVDEEGQLFYTMKMIQGKNLKEILRSIKNKDASAIAEFPLSRLLEIFISICDAMSYACSQNVIHRDLKPENIMVGNFGEVYLVDWGLAKVLNISNPTQEIPKWILKEVNEKYDEDTNRAIKELKKVKSLRNNNKALNLSFNDVLVGTPHYVAPERISGAADERSEVYALGAILYNILTLELTVSGETLEEVLTKVIKGDIKHPLSYEKKPPHLPNNKMPPGLAAVSMKALNVYANLRYQKISQLRREVSRWQDGFLTNAEKASSWMVLWAMMKRHKSETFAALGFLTLLIGIFTVYAFNLRAEKIIALNAESLSLRQKQVFELEASRLRKNTSLTEEKISELTSLAPELYNRSVSLLKSTRIKEAIQTISSAIKLAPKDKYILFKANLFQINGDFDKALELYQPLLEKKPDDNGLQESIRFSQDFLQRKLVNYTDFLRFNKLLTNQKRHDEAIIILKRLLRLGKTLRKDIISKLQNTHLSFISEKMITLTSQGDLILFLENRQISDISPLFGMPFTKLQLSGNPIDDISALKGMPLKELTLNNTRVHDLSPLEGMNLTYFSAKGSQISSLKSLSNQAINYLNISDTKISSINDTNLLFLKTLYAKNTDLTDIKFLTGKPLRVLSLRNTHVSDLTPLINSNIQDLDISFTKVSNISPLKNLSITRLIMNNVPVSGFSSLKLLPLNDLECNFTALNDLTPLRNKLISSLSLKGTLVTNISVLKGMPLHKLDISDTNVKDITPIYDSELTEININNTPVDLFPLIGKLPHIRSIYASGTQITHIPKLPRHEFNHLDISNTKITDISSLKQCSFTSLNMSDTMISDISPLEQKNFNNLNLQNSKIDNLSALSKSIIYDLNISFTKVKELKHVEDSKLKKLNISSTLIYSLRPLSKLRLRTLDFSSTRISSLSLLNVSALTHLNACQSYISDLTPFLSAKRLTELNLQSTNCESIEAILKLPLQKLILTNCRKIKSIAPLTNISTLTYLLIPNHVDDFSGLKNMPSLNILGRSTSEHWQPVSTFWQKYGKANEK